MIDPRIKKWRKQYKVLARPVRVGTAAVTVDLTASKVTMIPHDMSDELMHWRFKWLSQQTESTS